MPIQFITPSIISSVANTQVTGTITSAQLAGSITASQIASVNANTITSGSIPVAQVPRLSVAKMPVGTILQVVSAADSTYGQTSSTSFVDTTLSATITPTSSSSKILVLANLNGVGKGGANYYTNFRIIRGASTQVIYLMEGAGYTGTSELQIVSLSCAFLDSPATTSATTYKAQYLSSNGSFSAQYNWYVSTANITTSTITLLEIAA